MKLPDVAVLEKTRDFAALEEEWKDLYHDAPLATPFQSWAWLYSWWEHYGEGYELRLVTMRDEASLLVGLIPLMLGRRRGFGRLLFVGSGSTDYLDALARKGWEAQVAEAGSSTLRRMDFWHVADLQGLRPEAAAWDIFEGWGGPRARVWQDNFPVIDIRPWDELLASLSRNLRSTARRTLRRAEADGVRRELVGADEAEQAARRLVALHREAWQGRDITPEHLTRRFESHLRTAVPRITARGFGGISEFRRDGEVVASQFLIFGRDFVGQHLFGARRDALRRYQLSSLCIWDAANVARSRNSPYLNMLRGEEPYKLRWSSRIIPNYRAILGRSPVFWGPYVGYHALRSRAKRYVYSEDAPRWVKNGVTMYSSVLYDLTNCLKMVRCACRRQDIKHSLSAK